MKKGEVLEEDTDMNVSAGLGPLVREQFDILGSAAEHFPKSTPSRYAGFRYKGRKDQHGTPYCFLFAHLLTHQPA